MATSERQVQRITNNSSVPSNDSFRISSKLPISPSGFETCPNQASFALAQHTSDPVASIHVRVLFRHESSSENRLRFLHLSTERATRVLSSCTLFSPWRCAVVEFSR